MIYVRRIPVYPNSGRRQVNKVTASEKVKNAARINTLEAENAELKSRLDRLEAELHAK